MVINNAASFLLTRENGWALCSETSAAHQAKPLSLIVLIHFLRVILAESTGTLFFDFLLSSAWFVQEFALGSGQIQTYIHNMPFRRNIISSRNLPEDRADSDINSQYALWAFVHLKSPEWIYENHILTRTIETALSRFHRVSALVCRRDALCTD